MIRYPRLRISPYFPFNQGGTAFEEPGTVISPYFYMAVNASGDEMDLSTRFNDPIFYIGIDSTGDEMDLSKSS